MGWILFVTVRTCFSKLACWDKFIVAVASFACGFMGFATPALVATITGVGHSSPPLRVMNGGGIGMKTRFLERLGLRFYGLAPLTTAAQGVLGLAACFRVLAILHGTWVNRIVKRSSASLHRHRRTLARLTDICGGIVITTVDIIIIIGRGGASSFRLVRAKFIAGLLNRVAGCRAKWYWTSYFRTNWTLFICWYRSNTMIICCAEK